MYKQEIENVNPHKLIRDIESIVVFIGRYGRQSFEAVERMEMSRALMWVDILSEFIKAESGALTNSGETSYL